MGKHQIIYTSCKRGINGVNDGQQIYSYDASFNDSALDHVKSLFAYQVPTLAPGVVMSEEIAETMPQSFIYRRISDESCAIVLNTYLGRDYMGSAGRFGNYLSHGIICEELEINHYPCEFYGSELLRSRMDFNEVNSPDKPPFLPEPELIRGYQVDIESVIGFLNSDNRMDTYKKMLASMLAYERARKRVVICDRVENIIMWIAALHYSLPLEIALKVNFTTYEFDPSLSVSQICGVIPDGTRYSASNASTHFTFDFFKNIMPEIDTEGDFFDFIDLGMSLSFDSIQDFHCFIRNKLTYRNADERYYSAYGLYCFFTDGLNNLSLETFKNVVQMSNEFALEREQIEFVDKLLLEKDFILTTSDAYALEIFKAIMERMGTMNDEMQRYIKAMVTEKIITVFTSDFTDESNFIRFYSEIKTLCSENKISIPSELMQASNREKLLFSMQGNSKQWKWCFIADMLCEFVLTKHIPADELSMDYPIGKLIGDVIYTRISANENDGFELVTRIITKFSLECDYLLNMAFNIESILFDLPRSQHLILTFWKDIGQIIVKTHASNRQEIYSFFLSYERFDQVFEIYSEFMNSADGLKIAKELFQEQFEIQNKQYLQQFLLEVFDHYYAFLIHHRKSDTTYAKRELLHLVIQENLMPKFIDELINEVLETIPFKKSTKENEQFITVILDYYRKQTNATVPERLLLVLSGILFSQMRSTSDLVNAIRIMKNTAMSDAISLGGQSVTDIEAYIKWIAKPIFSCSKSAKNLIASYHLFKQTRTSSKNFVSAWAKESLNDSKGDKDYNSVLVFLEFLFNVSSADERKDVGKIFCKLNKQKLENLDGAVKMSFSDELCFLTQWEEIHQIAEATNPLFNNIGNLFRKK